MTTGKRILFSLALLFSATVSIAQKSPASESDLKKQAEKLFEKESYQEAAPMYSQLLSLYPGDAVFNYRYGVCLLMSGQDKTGAATYLEAAAKVKGTDADVHFYLGRSYMFMDHFNEALAEFGQFKKLGTSAKQSKLGVDRFIMNCNNANVLRMDRKNVAVLEKSKVSRSAFFAAYDFTDAAGKLLTTPDRFLTPIDKAKMPNPVMFMTRDGETIYFASYGKKDENGRDLYKTVKLPDGSWSEPSNLGGTVNTNADEDYPYLDKDGRTLYFSSTGHNSIGGYDVFRTQYDFNSGRWNDPVNIGMPINTVDDDLFFMPSTKGESASYSTSVETEAGKIEFRKIGLGNVVSNLAVISGQYISEDQVTRRDARITVIRTKDNGVVTSVKTDRTGKYELVLPAGEEYMLVVEGGSYLPHAENFSVPAGKTIPGMQQKVVMNKTTESEVLTMSNYFTPSAIDSSTASLEKPSQVKKSEFDMRDTATSKMQAITFEGRTLFVAPPSIKTPDVKAVVVNELAVKEKSDAPDYSEPNTQAPANTAADNKQGPGVNAESENKKEAAVVTAAMNEKTSNAEIVKMSFEDAQSMREEATTLRQEAIVMRTEAHELDSLSKEQLKQANLMLASGDKEMSQVVFKQSQENVLAAEIKNSEAKKLDADAHDKDLEFQTSYQEAVQLMKEFKVDTNSSSYQAIAVKEKEPESQEVQEEEVSASVNNVHAIRSKQLAAESDSLFTESKYVEEQAIATKDKKQKAFLNEKAKELNDQGESRLAESRLESDLAEKENEKPLAVISPEEKNAGSTSQENETVKTIDKESAPDKIAAPATGIKTTGSEPSINSQTENNSSNPSVNGGDSPTGKGENTSVVTPSMVATKPVVDAVNKIMPAENKPKQKSGPVANVEPAAQQHFENYREQLDESKRLEAASKETEAKLLTGNSPEKRDSLEAKTVELNKESIRQWQSASKELAMAKELDPEIEEKMTAAENNSAMKDEPVAQQQKNSESSSVNNDLKSGTEAGNVSKTESEVIPGAPANAPLAEAKPGPGKEVKPSTPAENIPVAANVSESADVKEVLDTTRPAYPEYVATQKEITTKQTETVDIFVEGMQLSKKASAIKKQEFDLRDQAAVSTDKKEKARLEERADSLAMEADVLAGQSKAMLSVAQKNTSEVKALKVKSDNLKSELIVKPEEQLQPAASVSPAGNTEGEKLAVQQKQTVNTGSEKLSTDSVLAANSSSSVSQAENESKAQKSSSPAEPEKSNQQQESITENKSGESKSQAETETEKESKDVKPGLAAETKTETVPAASATGNTQSGNKTESGKVISGEQTNSTKEINPTQEEEPSVTLSEKGVETEPSEVDQTKVEREMNVGGQQSQLVFEKEATDETTFSLAKSNANSESNAIPMDPALPEGLVFKVQIGAFRKPLPANAFNNLQPLSGETTRPGWIRYCLGLFRTFEPANLLKKEVRAMGYKDAFVVAYYNGKRIPLYDAYAIISKANATDKQTYSSVTANEFKQLEKFEIKKSSFDLKPDADTKAFYGTAENVPADFVEYAVQVGVYKTSRTPSALSTLMPLNTEQMSSGLFRFTTGRFDNRASADSMRRIAVNTGIKDAFIVIYRGGKKAGPREAQQIMSAARKETPVTTASATKPTPVSPIPGETISASDVVFKIQLGAFKENVPFSAVTSFLAVADKGITQETDARGLHIFYAGQYTNYDEALAARSEIASKGVKDAFIVAFVKGRRTNAIEALKLLNHN